MILSLWLPSTKPLNLMRLAPTSPQLIQHFILRISAARRQRLFPNSKPLPWGNCPELLVLRTNAVKFPPFHTGCTCWPVFVVIGACDQWWQMNCNYKWCVSLWRSEYLTVTFKITLGIPFSSGMIMRKFPECLVVSTSSLCPHDGHVT